MTIRLLRAVAHTELRSESHEARLLLLLAEAGARQMKSLDGITKLAKLDFLLRYPVALERALAAAKRDESLALVTDDERQSIEAKMIRFRYGPWDHRYRTWLGIMAGRGLVSLAIQGRTIKISLSEKGDETAQRVAERLEFSDLVSRARVVSTAFGSLPGVRLADMMYRVFPELLTMEWGSEISL